VAARATTTATRFVDAGAPAQLARLVAASDAAFVALPAVALALDHGLDPRDVARIRFVLDSRLALDRLRDRIAALPRADRWQTEARAALRDDFYESQHALTAAIITETDPTGGAETLVDAWIAAHATAVDRYRALVADVERAATADLAVLAVVRRALRDLAQI
jgi:glutamate dehydrogenase